jgi:ribosomal peptide maturation radical SAM protein 1
MITTANGFQQRGEKIILLVIPPFQSLRLPALNVSQLKANLLEQGHATEILYLNYLFAERITPHSHELISSTGAQLYGEFIFSFAMRERPDEDIVRYMDEIVNGTDLEQSLRIWFPNEEPIDATRRLICEAKEFIEHEAIDAVTSRNPWMLGCSSTFQSNCCSLAVIGEMKRRHPEVITVLGGANCEADMGEELWRQYPEIDYVGRGECDLTFIELVNGLAAGEKPTGLVGILGRADVEPTPVSPPLQPKDLDKQPHPDFSDYFYYLNNSTFTEQVRPGLVMESSRGCWWGEKHHCTFCAFNRNGMIFRSKSPDLVVEEIRAQVKRYGIPRISMADNILDMGYFKTVLKDLSEKPVAELFYETKSNLTLEQIRTMEAARVTWIQPGIESLSDLTLQLMRKGATGVQNIQLLKWCTESGIRISWNWLFGFPGEDEGEVDGMVETIQSLHHLQPPEGSAVLYLEKYSPYHMSPEEWGLEPIRPAKGYAHVYPFDDEALTHMAFFFEAEFFSGKQGSLAYAKLRAAVDHWRIVYGKSHLISAPRRNALEILDTRPAAKRFRHRLSGLKRKLFEYCNQQHSEERIQRTFAEEATPEEVLTALRSMVDDRLMVEGNGRYLSLATEARHAYKRFPEACPGGQLVQAAPANGSRSMRDRLVDLALGRIPPKRLARAVENRLRANAVRKTLAQNSTAT